MFTAPELEKTERAISMSEISFCLGKTCDNIAPGSTGFTGAFYKNLLEET